MYAINRGLQFDFLRPFRRLSLLVLVCLKLATAAAQDAFITKYDAFRRSQRCFTVTEEDNNQFGSVWWVDKVDFAGDTAFNFVVYMGDRDGNGADGLAFVMHTDPRDTLDNPSVYIGQRRNSAGQLIDMYQEGATGDAGGGLGTAIHNSAPVWNQRIWPSVIIEFDTWNNRDVQDGRSGTDCRGINLPQSPYYGWDHTAVVYNGDLYCQQQVITDANGNTGRILPIKPAYAYGTANNPDGSPYHNIEDNRCYMFQVRWTVNPDGTQTLQLWADVYNGSTDLTGLQLIMTHTDDMIGNVFNGESLLRFGFTGSTGGSINEQTVCLLGENLKPAAVDDYATIPLNTGAIIDITANDNDPDGDHLSVPWLVIPPRNGVASVYDSAGTDMLRYIPNVNYTGQDSLAYTTCDVNSTKCYAKCDTAWVYLDIICLPWQIDAVQIKPNEKCVEGTPDNGAAQAIPINPPFPGPIWFENFEDLPDGTTVDNGETAWSVSTLGTCKPGNVIEAQNGKFRVKKTGCEVIWASELLDISAYRDVSVTFDLWSSGHVDQNDYVKAFYIVDGGPEIPFDNGVFLGRFDTAVKASTSNINGQSLQIVIRLKTDDQGGGEENYFFDNVLIMGIGSPPLLQYAWYAGPAVDGPVLRDGETATGMAHGLYTVIAVEPITGCFSDPASVVIDSTGSRVSGGFVNLISPLSSCRQPYDGALIAGVVIGQDTLTAAHTFDWYYRESPRIGLPVRIGPLAQQLEGREYAVVITDNSTGCDTLINAVVPINVSIPNVQASVLSDVTNCRNPLSGAAEANVGGVTSGYHFEWYLGSSVQNRPPDYSGDTLRQLPSGEYTVRAVDIATDCPSDPVILQIAENLVYPKPLAYVLAQQISCDPNSMTGSLDAAVDAGGTAVTSGYDFMWFKGPNDAIPARPGYSDGPAVDGLESGPYRLMVTDQLTLCSSVLDTSIQDMRVQPVLTAVHTRPVGSCALPPNGSIEIIPDGPVHAFSYQIYQGWGVAAANLMYDGPDNIAGQLPAGDYTATATDRISGCVSEPGYVRVDDSTFVPAASIAVTPQISCDPLTLTGSLTAMPAQGLITDYNYAWFYGDTGGASVGTVSGTAGEMAHALDTGVYALRMIHLTTFCESIIYGRVPGQVNPPVLDPLAISPSDACGTMANGQIQASVDLGQTDPARYRFTWQYLETAAILPDTVASISGLAPGKYEVSVYDKLTGCSSLPLEAVVDDVSIIPDPELMATDDTSCNPLIGNGRLTVTGMRSGNPDLSAYSYTWYRNPVSGPPLGTPEYSFPNTPDSTAIAGLESGLYLLRVVNKINACESTTYASVTKAGYIPTIDSFRVADAVACSAPYLSSIEILAVSGGIAQPGQYTYEWFDTQIGNDMPQTGPVASDSLAAGHPMPAGRYRIRVINEYDCPSDYYYVDITDASQQPVLSLDILDNSSCLPVAFPNGSISATVDTAGFLRSDFNFDWYSLTAGAPLAHSDIVPTPGGEKAETLQEGTYRVTVYNLLTRCSSAELAILSHKQESIPLIDTTYIRALSHCIHPDGELGLKVQSVGTLPPLHISNRQYQFYLGSGTVLSDTLNALRAWSDPDGGQPDTASFRSLNSGFWTAAVLDMHTRCLSPSITVSIDRAPDLVIEILNKSAVTICGQANGLIEARAGSYHNQETAPPGPGFDFSWYYHGMASAQPGLPLGAAHNGSESAFRSEKIGLQSGFYSIEVYDRATGCRDSLMTNLDVQEVPMALITNAVPSDQCEPGNGRIDYEIQSQAGSTTIDQYLIYLFRGGEVDEARVIASHKPPAGSTYPYNNQFDALAAGTYTIAIKEDFGTNECYSEKAMEVVVYAGPSPDLLTATLSEDFSCPGAAGGTGQLTELNLANPGYEFIWYLGTDTTAAGISVHGGADQSDPASWVPGNSLTSDNLYGGVYTLVVRDRIGPGLGCVYTAWHALPGTLKTIQIAQAPVTDKTHCSIDNGTAGVLTVRENGGPEIAVDTTDYRFFQLLDPDYNLLASTVPGPIPVLGSAGQPFNGLTEGGYFLVARDTRTNCSSQPKSVAIRNTAAGPDLTIIQLNPDFNCSGSTSSGALMAMANGDTLTSAFDIAWYSGSDLSQASIGSFFRIDNLAGTAGGQIYTAVVTDRDAGDGNLGCSSIIEGLVRHSPTKISISHTDLLAEPVTHCADPPDGAIAVLQIQEDFLNGTVTGTGPSYVGQYAIQLMNEDFNQLDPVQYPHAVPDLHSGRFENVPGGIYYVRAMNLETGCEYGPGTRLQVDNLSRVPSAEVALIQPDFSCEGGLPTGIAQISIVSGGSDGDNSHLHFQYEWTQVHSGISVPEDGITVPSGIRDLARGVYSVRVTDMHGPDSLCTNTFSVNIPRIERNLAISDARALPQMVCYPDGRIFSSAVRLEGVDFNLPDPGFSILLHDDQMTDISTLVNGSGLPGDPFRDLPPGVYYLQGVDLNTHCPTAPVAVTVDDLSENPAVTTAIHSPQYSLNPDAATWTGVISGHAREMDGNEFPQGYSYQWYAGTGLAGAALSPDTLITGLDEGYYTLEAISDSTRCSSTQTVFLPFVYLRPAFYPLASPQTLCHPADGALFIPEIFLEGAPDDLSDYSFSAFHSHFHTGAPDSVFAGVDTGNNYDQLSEGTYYFVARENDWWVESYPVRVEIDDLAPYPILLYDENRSQNQTSCDPSTSANGAVAVQTTEPDGTIGLYQYSWFDPAGLLIPDSAGNRISGLTSGLYRVEVLNTLTGCAAEALLPIGENPVIPIITASSTPLTNCDPGRSNGAVSGYVVNALSAFGQENDYIFNWYGGGSVLAPADYTGQAWNGLTDGIYTLQAIEVHNSTCVSQPVTVVVARQTVDPLLGVKEISPLTHCDAIKANAVFEATADGNIIGFTFTWNDQSGNIVAESPRATHLGDQGYSVRAVNDATGCWSETTLRPSLSLDIVAAPAVDVLQNRTSCLEPDAMASASIQGDIAGYIFRFYHSDTETQLGNPYSGTVLYNLEVGNYHVIAESRESGCFSPPAPFRITDDRYFPEFLVSTSPSSCDEPTGSAEIAIGDLNRPHSINWYDAHGYAGGEEYMNFLPVGRFTVEVEGSEGCISIKEVEVTGDITVYNGVSANGDGVNDYFQIKCLEFFPDNLVRIFNRAGNLIYEMEYYDMHDPNRRFTGESNRGMNIGHSSLPEGTYFYIVDKRDGSDQKVGYLELKR